MTTRKNNIDSKIITTQHAELISKWIDRLKITDEIKTAYKFNLLLRGSRDGFTNSGDIESYILSRVENEEFAIHNYRTNGPRFGDDLALISNYGFCENNHYENQIRETTNDFFVEEYEVFQVIR
ncbi:carbohydrate-binding module family 13 protein [Rhizophagus irregularis DAOM 181602=DAOM 197198]|nr:carbohydrate-binding module family 13 protein [Rhizophagus irregularis DAOM 181602=DAOM 197198]